MIDWKTIPKTGDIRLEDGELRCYDPAGAYIARVALTRSGLTLMNTELCGFQPGDPFKFRATSDYAGARGGYGGFSAGIMRQDGTADELTTCMAALAEDAQPGERRAQFQVSIVGPSGEIEPVLVATSAYAVELFGAFVTWVAMANPQGSLLKFRPPVRPPLPPPVPPTDPPLDPYIDEKVKYFTGPNGELDFEKIRAYYGFESEDVQHFLDGDMTAAQVVIEMEHRKAGDAP